MQRSNLKPLPLIIIATAFAFGLVGCGPAAAEQPAAPQQEKPAEQTDAPVSGASDAGQSGEAILSYGDYTFTAKLQFCALTSGEDALFHGVAVDESGAEVGYLDGDFGGIADTPHGEARIDFGATGQFQSSDDFVAMGTVAGQIVVTDSSDSSLIVMGGTWDQNGTELGTATLRVNC